MLNDREAPLRFLRHGVRTDRLGRGVSQDLSDRRDRSARGVCVGGDKPALPELAAPAERERLERVRQRQCRSSWVVLDRRDAICGIRHVFLEEDADGPGLLAALTTRPDLPPPSYVLHSSPGRVHVFWRVRGFDAGTVETMQKRLARELRSDTAATSCAQTTRLPGFANHKRQTPSPVTIEYLRPTSGVRNRRFSAGSIDSSQTPAERHVSSAVMFADRAARAQRFLLAVEPAVAGQHGDLRTFRICCRVVRGFELSDRRGDVRSLRVERTVSAAVVRTGVADQGSERQEVRPRASRWHSSTDANERDSCVSSYTR